MRTASLALLSVAASLSWLSCTAAVPTECELPSDEAFLLRRADEAGEGLARGARLFDAHCEVCHGRLGDGDGPASRFLFPAPRDFTRARFRLVSTDNGVPTHEDLTRTIRRGVPGSAMPAWAWLGGEEVDELAAYVRWLAEEGLAHDLYVEGLSEEHAVAEARARTTPGVVLPRVAKVEPSEDVLAEGRSLYRTGCATCHGDEGEGRPRPRFDEDGALNWPRDLTAGYLKGGRTAHALGWRIQAGLPGSAMPPTKLATRELEALVAYLRSIVPAEAETNLVHRRGRVVARRVEVLPAGPQDPRWSQFEPATVVLAPLSSAPHQRGVTGATIAAAHDGERVALRVRWSDDSGDPRVWSDLAAPDACALQFNGDERPPLFGMGSARHRTNVWHWRALRLSELAGDLGLYGAPHAVTRTFGGEARTDVPLYRPAEEAPDPSRAVDSHRASGVGELVPGPGVVDATPRWADGEWSVVFTRSLAPADERDVALAPGARLNLALALWNGGAGDRGPRKSISIWQAFELEP